MPNAQSDIKVQGKGAYVLVLLVFVLWGSAFPITKFAYLSFEPFIVNGIRITCGFFVMLIAMLAGRKWVKIEKKSDWAVFAFMGLLMYCFSTGMTQVSNANLPSSLASILNVTIQLCIPIFALFILKEIPSFKVVMGIGIGFVGAVVVLFGAMDGVTVLGIVAALLGVASWALGSVLVRNFGKRYSAEQIGVCAYPFAIVGSFCAGAVQTSMAGGPKEFQIVALLAAIYAGVVCSGIANLLWNKSLIKLPAAKASSFYPMSPFVSTVVSILVLGEAVTGQFVIGAVLICVGVVLAVTGKVRKKEEAPQDASERVAEP